MSGGSFEGSLGTTVTGSIIVLREATVSVGDGVDINIGVGVGALQKLLGDCSSAIGGSDSRRSVTVGNFTKERSKAADGRSWVALGHSGAFDLFGRPVLPVGWVDLRRKRLPEVSNGIGLRWWGRC